MGEIQRPFFSALAREVVNSLHARGFSYYLVLFRQSRKKKKSTVAPNVFTARLVPRPRKVVKSPRAKPVARIFRRGRNLARAVPFAMGLFINFLADALVYARSRK